MNCYTTVVGPVLLTDNEATQEGDRKERRNGFAKGSIMGHISSMKRFLHGRKSLKFLKDLGVSRIKSPALLKEAQDFGKRSGLRPQDFAY